MTNDDRESAVPVRRQCLWCLSAALSRPWQLLTTTYSAIREALGSANRPTASPAVSPTTRRNRYLTSPASARKGFDAWKIDFLNRIEMESSKTAEGQEALAQVFGAIAALPVGPDLEVDQPHFGAAVASGWTVEDPLSGYEDWEDQSTLPSHH